MVTKAPPEAVGYNSYLDRTKVCGEALLTSPYYANTTRPQDKLKQIISDSTQQNELDGIKWGIVTYVPPKEADTRYFWQRWLGMGEGPEHAPVCVNIFSDATHCGIPAITDDRDPLNEIQPTFETDTALRPGNKVQLQMFSPNNQFQSLGGNKIPSGKIIAYNEGISPLEGVRKRLCETPHKVPGRKSTVSDACAKAWNRQSPEFPNTTDGKYPTNPVTGLWRAEDGPEVLLKLSEQEDYGPRIHPKKKKYSFHPGIDLNKTNSGVDMKAAKLYAALGGVVDTIGVSESWGNFVIIDHGPYYDIVEGAKTTRNTGLFTIYAHLSSKSTTRNVPFVLKKVGQKIKQGAQIAVSDNSGVSTGPHLHFEVVWSGLTPKWNKNFDTLPRTDPVVFFNTRFKRRK
jgi:hypothetical protein